MKSILIIRSILYIEFNNFAQLERLHPASLGQFWVHSVSSLLHRQLDYQQLRWKNILPVGLPLVLACLSSQTAHNQFTTEISSGLPNISSIPLMMRAGRCCYFEILFDKIKNGCYHVSFCLVYYITTSGVYYSSIVHTGT